MHIQVQCVMERAHCTCLAAIPLSREAGRSLRGTPCFPTPETWQQLRRQLLEPRRGRWAVRRQDQAVFNGMTLWLSSFHAALISFKSQVSCSVLPWRFHVSPLDTPYPALCLAVALERGGEPVILGRSHQRAYLSDPQVSRAHVSLGWKRTKAGDHALVLATVRWRASRCGRALNTLPPVPPCSWAATPCAS